MELAKVTSKGQITIPASVRNKLGLKSGDQVAFMPEGDNYVIVNANIESLLATREAFKGMAEELGLETEQDVVDLVKEIRAERSDKYICE